MKIAFGNYFPNITSHGFVCDSENYMENLLGRNLLGNLIADASKNVFGVNFATIFVWSVVFTGVVLAKGCEFLLVSLGEGCGVWFRWVCEG